jgi:hypothetical protein
MRSIDLLAVFVNAKGLEAVNAITIVDMAVIGLVVVVVVVFTIVDMAVKGLEAVIVNVGASVQRNLRPHLHRL